MFKLAMAPFHAGLIPAILFKQFDDFSNFHVPNSKILSLPPNDPAHLPGPPANLYVAPNQDGGPGQLHPFVMLLLYGFEPGITSVEDTIQVIFPSSKSM